MISRTCFGLFGVLVRSWGRVDEQNWVLRSDRSFHRFVGDDQGFIAENLSVFVDWHRSVFYSNVEGTLTS